jgi:beta-galactosidase
MSDSIEISRRTFIRTTALATASAAVAHSAERPAMAAAAQTANPQSPVPEKPNFQGSVFPYGGVYFRKTNPPAADWARDHQTAAHIGMNTFRHWFLWGSIEVAPGKFDWADYDRMMDLAAQNGIKVIISELVADAPEWAFRKFASARYRGSDGTVIGSNTWVSSATGGSPGLCLDNPEVRQAAEKYITALVERYRNHPALLGYDLWNENTYEGGTPHRMYCYCEGTKKKLREWLNARYGSLDAMGKAWHRYSYETWDDVEPPESFSGYADSLDWLEFRIDNAYSQFDWRVKIFRRLDPKHLVTAHGTAGTLETLPSSTHNEWRSAERVDVWGLTWITARKGNEPWRQFQALDLVRGGARGKPFWHAEIQGGPLWMQPQVIGRPEDDGRIPDADDVRLWNLVSCAGGARGILYCRYRPLLDGPLFGAFGPFAMDGSMTPRSEMAGKIAQWTNSHPALWQSRPVKGDVGIVFAPESELFNYVQQGSTDFYAESVRGAYQAFFDSNIQPDFVALDDIGAYKLIYLPYPVMLKADSAAKLRRYVEQGGTLISEGVPAYFGDHGHVGMVQPNFGLDEVFGARESFVAFEPDISDNLMLEVNGSQINGRYFRQEYELRGGRAVGRFANGNIAAVENRFGRGRALLIGSFPGAGYYHHHAPATKALFAGFLKLAEVTPRLTIDDNAVQGRLHQGAGGNYLWLINPTRKPRTVKVSCAADIVKFASAEDLWGRQAVTLDGQQLTVSLPPRDAAVIALR